MVALRQARTFVESVDFWSFYVLRLGNEDFAILRFALFELGCEWWRDALLRHFKSCLRHLFPWRKARRFSEASTNFWYLS